MGIKGRTWQTPLDNMKIGKGKAIIKGVPILATGLWKGTLVVEDNIDEVIAFQEADGPCHVVLDHDERVETWIGTATNYVKQTHKQGYILIKADLEIVDENTIKKLKFVKEKGGGLMGISPRIEWSDMDEDGNIEGLKTPHISIVIDPAQGFITRLSESGTFFVEFVKEVKDMAGKKTELKLELMSVEDFRKKIKCPECSAIMSQGTKKCSKCEAEIPADTKPMSVTETAICPECKSKIDVAAGKCSGCGKTLDELGYIIPFPIDGIGSDEEVTLPKAIAQEIDQLLNNPNVDDAAWRGFFEKVREALKKKKKKKPEEEEPEEEEPGAKKKKEPEKDDKTGKHRRKDYPYPERKNKSYAFPAQDKIEKLADAVYTKELLRPGVFLRPDGSSYIPVNDEFMKAVLENTNKIFSGRNPVFVGHPEEGKESADKVVGWVSDYKLDNSLFGKVEVTNEAVKEKIDEKTLRDASLCIAPRFIDEHGVVHGPTITHLAITATPHIRGLEEFKRFVASDDAIEVEAIVEAKDSPFGESQVNELREKLEANEEQTKELNEKYEELMKAKLMEAEDAALNRVGKLIDDELFKPAAKERLEELMKKAVGLRFDDKRNMAEALLDVLESGLMKGEVSLTDRKTQDTGVAVEYLTLEDLERFKGRITYYEREGEIARDAKDRPYWVKSRPEAD